MIGISLNSEQCLVVEVEKTKESARQNSDIEIATRSFCNGLETVVNGRTFTTLDFSCSVLRTNVSKMTVVLSNSPADQTFPLRPIVNSANILIYQNVDDAPCAETIEDDDDGQGDSVVGSHRWALPNCEFDGYWDNLIFDTDVKEEIINYAAAMMRLAESSVDNSVICSNRMILFYGPPGTGKTTLCKAIAQKLTIRMSRNYTSAQFIEINSHSLFSKWFSESGKLVMKMFEKIHAILEDENCLVFVLIDEVESLTKARESSLSSSEPSDAVRVVNALLTQIDYIKRFPNVLILTTSNLANAIDDAFLDRADIKQFVGPPSTVAVYKILMSCIQELKIKRVISHFYISASVNVNDPLSRELFQIAKSCDGFSGRALRKLPVIAYGLLGAPKVVDIARFLKGLQSAVNKVKNGPQVGRAVNNEMVVEEEEN